MLCQPTRVHADDEKAEAEWPARHVERRGVDPRAVWLRAVRGAGWGWGALCMIILALVYQLRRVLGNAKRLERRVRELEEENQRLRGIYPSPSDRFESFTYTYQHYEQRLARLEDPHPGLHPSRREHDDVEYRVSSLENTQRIAGMRLDRTSELMRKILKHLRQASAPAAAEAAPKPHR